MSDDNLLRPIPPHLKLVKPTPEFGSTPMGGQVGDSAFDWSELRPSEIETVGNPTTLVSPPETTPEQRDIHALALRLEELTEAVDEIGNSVIELSAMKPPKQPNYTHDIMRLIREIRDTLEKHGRGIQLLTGDIDRIDSLLETKTDPAKAQPIRLRNTTTGELYTRERGPEGRFEIHGDEVVVWEAEPTKTAVFDPDANFLRWVAERLVNVYGESPNVDYVLKLRDLAFELDSQA